MSKVFYFLFWVPTLFGYSFISCHSKNHTHTKNTLYVVSEERIKNLDPIFSDDLYSVNQVGQVYETLLEYDYLARPFLLKPLIAETMPHLESDGLTYTFHLKKGIFFQDDPCFESTLGHGREMIAEDFVYSLKRLFHPRLNSPGWWLFEGVISGVDSWRESLKKDQHSTAWGSHLENDSFLAPIDGLKAVNRHTLQIKLSSAAFKNPRFLFSLAMPVTSVVPREAVQFYEKDFSNHPVGTGPFRLIEYQPQTQLVWQSNPTYRTDTYPLKGSSEDQTLGLLKDASKRIPLIDQVVVKIFTEHQPMWLTFLQGQLDIVNLPADQFASAITPGKELVGDLRVKGIQLVKNSGFDVTHISFNMSDELLGKNKALRQALSLAYDGPTFIDLFYNGQAVPAQGPIPPDIEGYDPEVVNPYRQFNVSRAKELLAKAGYPGGEGLPHLSYATLADSVSRHESEYIKKMFSQIGVQLNINYYSWPQLQEIIKTKKAQLWEQAWVADYPDGENFLQLFYSKNQSPGPNDSNYSNPKFDEAYEKLSLLSEKEKRNLLYKQMVQLLIEDCPWIFVAHRTHYRLIQPWLKNFKFNPFNHSSYKYYRVDREFKK